MVNRNVRVRTPRKTKQWVGRLLTAIDVSAAGIQQPINLLETALTNLGINRTQQVTVMRIFGTVGLTQVAASAAVEYRTRSFGIAWLPSRVANASAGDSQIPRPMQPLREAEWLQQWELGGIAQTTGDFVSGAPMLPIERSYREVDITQMRKQPTSDHELVMVVNGAAGFDTDTVDLWGDLQIMLALP